MPIDLLTKTHQLDSLAEEWRHLWLTDPNATPFQSPEWLIPWWRQLGEGDLHTLILRDDAGHLTSILPMYIYPQPGSGERHLLLLGAGTSDYLDGIFAPGANAAPLLERLVQHSHSFDRAIFHQLRPVSLLLQYAQARSLSIKISETCFGIDAHTRLPSKIIANSGRYLRRTQAQGTVDFAPAATVSEALALFDHLILLHQGRWQPRGEPAVLAPERVQAHHREAIPRLLAAGLLRLFRLRVNGEIIGILYCMLDHTRRTLYHYLIAFDERFADLSPGTLLLHFAREYCLAENIIRLDFLRGGERYKHFWGATESPAYSFTLEDS